MPVAGLHGESSVHWFESGGHTVTLCVCTHCPASHPAAVHRFWSLSVHGVLSGTGGWSQSPVVGLHGRSCVHSFESGGHVVVMCVWTHTPASHPGVVHALL